MDELHDDIHERGYQDNNPVEKDNYWDEGTSEPRQDDPFDDDFTFWKLWL